MNEMVEKKEIKEENMDGLRKNKGRRQRREQQELVAILDMQSWIGRWIEGRRHERSLGRRRLRKERMRK